jgi:hypothetical protein
MAMRYLDAEAVLSAAEARAWAQQDFDTLARLYMPLQETRRQIRQRCGEGIVDLRLLASGPDDQPDPQRIVEEIPHGQLLVAGWGSIQPALEVRRLAAERNLYLETFLGAVYPIGAGRLVAIVATADVRLPERKVGSLDGLLGALPPHSLAFNETELLPGPRCGTPDTYAHVMELWERLHLPYLAAADMQIDPMQKIQGYRRTIQVDYACELAHQKLSAVARELARRQREGQ